MRWMAKAVVTWTVPGVAERTAVQSPLGYTHPCPRASAQ